MRLFPFRRRRHLFVPILVVLLAAASCGGGEGDGAAEPNDEKEEAPIAYAKCMREQGIDAPDPSPGERGFGFVRPEEGSDDTKFNEARDICEERVQAAFQFLSEEDELLFGKLSALAKCMRDKGLDFPDPDPSTDKGAGEYIKRVADPGNPQFEEADDACREQVFGGADQGPGGERGTEGGDDPS